MRIYATKVGYVKWIAHSPQSDDNNVQNHLQW